jgi:hypothetical protein
MPSKSPTVSADDLAATVADLNARLTKLERDAQFADVRRAARPEIAAICATYGIQLPEPDASGLIDATQVLTDLRQRSGFADGKFEKHHANRLEALLRQCGWTA